MQIQKGQDGQMENNYQYLLPFLAIRGAVVGKTLVETKWTYVGIYISISGFDL